MNEHDKFGTCVMVVDSKIEKDCVLICRYASEILEEIR